MRICLQRILGGWDFISSEMSLIMIKINPLYLERKREPSFITEKIEDICAPHLYEWMEKVSLFLIEPYEQNTILSRASHIKTAKRLSKSCPKSFD